MAGCKTRVKQIRKKNKRKNDMEKQSSYEIFLFEKYKIFFLKNTKI